jgi:hypothetical protein
MNLSRFQRLLDVWGSDPNQWPSRERARAERLLIDPAARRILDQARTLDKAIYRAELAAQARSDDDAVARILAGLRLRPRPQQRQPLLSSRWWNNPREHDVTWPRLAALACGATLGIMVGLSSFGMTVATSLDLGLVRATSTDADLSGNVFDADSVTGLRP